jgi:Fe-S cluster assembly protein SufD
MDAKPELEIYADDVKCAHGSTVGQLDEVALAYLRSRGIPRDTARALLLRAFATEILDRVEWPGLRALIETLLHLPSDMPEVIDA